MKYPKIQTLFDRKEDFTVDENKIRWKEFGIPKVWEVTEKIDGTNVRIILEKTFGNKTILCPNDEKEEYLEKYGTYEVKYSGRTDKSQLPANLLSYLTKTFTVEKVKQALTHEDEKTHELKTPDKVIIFGEGYGKGIQKAGEQYRSDVAVRIFDVFICDNNNTFGGWWLERDAIEDIANKIGVKVVPLIGPNIGDRNSLCLEEIVSFVRDHSLSIVAMEDHDYTSWEKWITDQKSPTRMEGIVAKTNLFTRKGERLMFKLKYSDFHGGNKE